MADIPESIGKYKIVSLVAKGGMGTIFKALHPTLKRYVIIKKLIMRGNAAMQERFKREAQILIDLNDPRIVHLFDFFKEGNSHYIVLEYVDGMSLDVLLKKRRYLSGVLSLYVFLDACRGLKYAHDSGIIHRDIKPGNILISKNGSIKLADFGIAATDDEEDDGLTKEGMTLGTASYMPPEQFKNTKNVDKRADIYAMGIMLYEMVTGKKPFPGNFSAETLLLIQKGKYAPAKKVNPETPRIVTRLLKKMIRPNPRKRFQDMEPVIRIIEKFLSRYPADAIQKCLIDSMADGDFVEPVFKPRKKKRVMAFFALLLILASSFGGYAAWNKGYVHRYILSDSYGAVRVSVRMPVSVKDSEDIFLKARLFANDRADYPEALPGAILFSVNPAEGEKYSFRFDSGTIYVKKGQYRLKVYAEQRIYWYTFKAESIENLAAQGKTEQEISLNFDRVENQILSVRTETFDAINGRNVTAAAKYSVLEGDQWIPLGEYPQDRLMTGGIRKFRAELPGYYPEIFSLKIAPYQSELFLHAELVPLSASLTVSAPDGKVRMKLNGSQSLILGGEDMREGSIADYRGGKKTWNLPSGKYDLEITDGKKSVHTVVSISPEESASVTVTAADDGTLRIQKE